MSYCLIYILCSTFWNAFVEKSCSKLFADPPSALRVVNITHRSVQLEWQPGFHGGMDQYFRLEYNSNGKSQVRIFQIIVKLSQSKKEMKIRVAANYSKTTKSQFLHFFSRFLKSGQIVFTTLLSFISKFKKVLPLSMVLVCFMKSTWPYQNKQAFLF